MNKTLSDERKGFVKSLANASSLLSVREINKLKMNNHDLDQRQIRFKVIKNPLRYEAKYERELFIRSL